MGWHWEQHLLQLLTTMGQWLQVFYNGTWGTITASANYWGLKEAAVVCRMLGLPADDPQP